MEAEDSEIWQRARNLGMVIVTKDRDFEQLCALREAPPKVVWLRVGNRTTQQLENLMRQSSAAIRAFVESPESALLILAATVAET